METPNSNLPQQDFFEETLESEKVLKNDVQEQSIKSAIKQPISDVLNNLIKKGQITETFHVFDIDWEMRLLNQDDLLNVQKETISKGLSESFTSRFSSNIIETLSTAIMSINGKPINSIFKDVNKNDYDTEDGYNTVIRNKLRTYLGKLATDILDELFNRYTELNNKRVKEINELKKK
jgi:hypothetical protein